VQIQEDEADAEPKTNTVKLPNYTKVTIITNINHSLNKEQFLEKLIAVKTHMKDFRLQGQAEKWSKQMSDIPRQMEKF
jgi:hypothetical protein